MSSTDALVFYNREWSPLSQGIKLVLLAADLPHETVELSADDVSNQTMPTLSQNGVKSISGYEEAIKFLGDVNGRQLTSDNDEERTRQSNILEYFIKHILPYFERSVVLSSPREGFDLFLEAVSFLENHLSSGSGQFFGGSQPNFVDFGIFPYLEKVGKWTPALQPHQCPYTQAWIRTVKKEPLVRQQLSENDIQKHLEEYTKSLKTHLAA